MMIIIYILLAIIIWITVDLTIGTQLHKKHIPTNESHSIRHSDIQFFSQGDKFFDHMLTHIDQARDHIHIQFYIFRDDNIGMKFLHELKEKASAGIDVRLMIDFSGYHISRKNRKSLENAGIKIAKTNKPKLPLLWHSLNVRNHRKVAIIDGKHGYIGGYNVGDEYLGRDPKKGRWRDYHLYIQGEAIQDLQSQFLTDWKGASGEDVDKQTLTSPPLPPGPTPAQVIPNDGHHVVEMLEGFLDKATTSIFIGTPYFIPGERLYKKLLKLANNGVKIKLLLPKYPDHPLVKDAAYPYFPELLDAGVEIRQFYEGFYHAKVLIINGAFIDIGTSNFDKRSFYINKEINVLIDTADWVKPVKEEIEKDFYESAEEITFEHIKNRSFIEKVKEKIATALSRFL